jgi:response regulator RpfG family c-di-GMP phosphodiesterase
MSQLEKPCLLVVDDEPDVCDSVFHLLRRKYNVLRATSATAAVELMAQHEVHIIMTDQRMPHVTGVEMLQNVKTKYPEAIRMLFTGYADIQSVIAAINQGHVYRYLSKPWQPEELEAAVADAATEYTRMEKRACELSECMTKLGDLDGEVRRLHDRIGRLEQENQRLCKLVNSGASKLL